MTTARVAHEARRFRDVIVGAAALRYPNDVRAQLRRLRLLQQMLLDFGGPPKTAPSSRGDEHQHAHLADIRVERRAQIGLVRGEPLVGQRGSLCPAGTEDHSRLSGANNLNMVFMAFGSISR